LQAAPRDISTPFRLGGGFRNWLWKGDDKTESLEITLSVSLNNTVPAGLPITHRIKLSVGDPLITEEIIGNINSADNDDFYYKLEKESQFLKVETGKKSLKATLNKVNFNRNQSVLSQYKGEASFPVISKIGTLYESIRIYKSYKYSNDLMRPSESDLPSDFLLETYSNFVLVLFSLINNPDTKDVITDKLYSLNEDIDFIQVKLSSGNAELFVFEKDLSTPIPATRLSDGTLRYLSLLSILCHPSPPPFICIEEPEIGLHPDILSSVAELLVEASKKTQLIVTTHSDFLVSALSDQPASVVVCERDTEGSRMRRLEQDKLKDWLKKYSLGELWMSGHLGGTRW
jgi:predicted ATPase